MRTRILVPVLSLALLATPAAAQSEPTLYHRLGGYDRIAAVVDDFMVRFDGDSMLAPFLGGLNATAGARIRQHFVDFICSQTGGPCLYTGQEMVEAHAGLRIQPAHFNAVMGHLEAALVEARVDTSARTELLRQLDALRDDMVEG